MSLTNAVMSFNPGYFESGKVIKIRSGASVGRADYVAAPLPLEESHKALARQVDDLTMALEGLQKEFRRLHDEVVELAEMVREKS